MPAITASEDKHNYRALSSSEEDGALNSNLSSYDYSSLKYNYNLHLRVLIIVNIILLVFLGVSWLLFSISKAQDPSLHLWSPANSAVKYHTVTFDSYFFNRSPYLGTPAAEKDAMWESLYDFGITGLSESEASHLTNFTLPAPNDASKFVVQLNVFHLLHCVNLLRKAIYPDEYPGWEYHENGTVNHNTVLGYHWDHCIDTLRQSIMCDADVTPLSFTHEHEGDYNIFPKLTATHTCRNFEAVREWAKKRQIKSWIGSDPKHAHEKQKGI